MAGQNHFLPGQSDAFYSYFNANEEYEQRFYSNSYDSYPGSGYWRDNFLRSQVAQATTQTQAEQNLLVQ